MDTIDWEAFLKGWQGQPTTSPTSSSESELLTSSVENAEPILSKSSFKPSAEPFVEFLAESAGPGLIGREVFSRCYFDEDEDDSAPTLSPKSDKEQQSDK